MPICPSSFSTWYVRLPLFLSRLSHLHRQRHTIEYLYTLTHTQTDRPTDRQTNKQTHTNLPSVESISDRSVLCPALTLPLSPLPVTTTVPTAFTSMTRQVAAEIAFNLPPHGRRCSAWVSLVRRSVSWHFGENQRQQYYSGFDAVGRKINFPLAGKDRSINVIFSCVSYRSSECRRSSEKLERSLSSFVTGRKRLWSENEWRYIWNAVTAEIARCVCSRDCQVLSWENSGRFQ